MNKFLERYQRGEYQQVWNELYTLGSKVREALFYFDALAVVHETMRRVRHNIEILIPRLEDCGYQFGYTWMEDWPDVDRDWVAGQPSRFTPPPSDILTKIEHFENIAGSLPLSLRAFYMEVGEVNFVGIHPKWDEFFLANSTRGLEPPNYDTLFVWGLRKDIFEYCLSWQKQKRDAQPFLLPISADAYFKYNISGSGSYEIAIPNLSADAPLLNEWHQTTFVDYLRVCLYYGGLPGTQRIANNIPDELIYLCKDLLPI